MSGSEILRTYTRVVTTDSGSSAFEDAELPLAGEPGRAPSPAMYVATLGRTTGVAVVRFGDFPDEPHPAMGAQWVVMLRGTIEVQVGDGSTRRFGPGDLVLATDTTGLGHVTRTVGDLPHEALGISCALRDGSRGLPDAW
jgi:hypothetical protein